MILRSERVKQSLSSPRNKLEANAYGHNVVMWRRLFSVLLISSVIVDHERTHLIIIIFFFMIHHHHHWLSISRHSPSPLSYRCCQSNKHCTSTHFNHLWNKEDVSFLDLGRKYNNIQNLQPKCNNMHDFTILYLTLRFSNIWSNKNKQKRFRGHLHASWTSENL